MSSRPFVFRLLLILPLFGLGLTSCAGLGTLSDVLASTGGLGGQSLNGEVRRVDSRRQEIDVRGSLGRTERVRYDSRTQVVYRQQRYPVSRLRSGDVVRMQVDRNTRSGLYARRIELRESLQERRVSGQRPLRLQRFEGSVARVDARGGWFELHPPRGGAILVMLPYQANRTVQDRFRRLRAGHRIRIEGERLNTNRVELYRFY